MKSHARRFGSASATTALVAAAALSGCSAGDIAGGDDEGDENTLTFLVDNSEDTTAAAESLADAFEATHDGVTVTVETRPQGAEGDNVVKTRLSTGDMTDVFQYKPSDGTTTKRITVQLVIVGAGVSTCAPIEPPPS